MGYIDAASNLYDLSKFRGLNLEKLEGNRKEQFSVRLNDQFRLIFTLEKADEIIIKEIGDYH